MEFFKKMLSPDPEGATGSGDVSGGSGNNAGDLHTGGGGGGAATLDESPSWIDVLPDEAAKDPEITKYKTPDDFYKAYRNKTEMLGRKGVIIPKDDAPPEEIEKYYNALGRPEKPDGYKIEVPEKLHKSIQITDESIKGYSMLAHKWGLNQKQAQGINNDFLAMQNQAAIEHERRETEVMNAAQAALRTEWGPRYDANLKSVASAVLKVGGQEWLNALGGIDGLGNNPIHLKNMAKITSLLSEDRLSTMQINTGGAAPSGGGETREQAIFKINEMMSDPKNPINNERDPKRSEAVAERMRLYKIAYPNQEES